MLKPPTLPGNPTKLNQGFMLFKGVGQAFGWVYLRRYSLNYPCWVPAISLLLLTRIIFLKGDTDEFHYMYLETSGDATFTALIEGFEAPGPGAKAGVSNTIVVSRCRCLRNPVHL